MAKIQWQMVGNTITVLLENNPRVLQINRDHKYAKTILELLVTDNATEQELLDLFDRAKAFEKQVKDINIKVGGNQLSVTRKNGTVVVKYNDEELGGVVVDRIIQFMDEGLPVDSLAKFVVRLMANPSFNSRKQLYSFLEALKMPITCEGTFLACKGVRGDYKDCHTGTIDNRPGAPIKRMERSDVDDNPDNHCSSGYHCGSWKYSSSFGARTVLVEVDPADVVSVPNDFNAQKCRVTFYKVLSDLTVPINGPLKDVNPPVETVDEVEEDDIVCPKCGGEAELSEDGSVVCSRCDPEDCDRLYTCSECMAELKSVHHKLEYRPDNCPNCGAAVNWCH